MRGAHSEQRVCNPHHGERNDQERRNLNSEGPGPKAYGSTVRDVCFLKCFWVPNNIVKYDDKTNPNIWLEDYHLACRASRADDDLFIIQFLPIYLANTARAWLDQLLRSMINFWEDLKEIFTGNLQGTYVWLGNP
jgi:hypothetical protein